LTGDTVGIAYLIAKAGILALTKALAQYLGPDNVNVNALALGPIDTQSTIRHLTAKEIKELKAEAALKRLGTPREIAREIVFLASDDSDFITGQTIVADGGYAMR
jgi:3-oxoacyl-[acyl-carrier protein] reductase